MDEEEREEFERKYTRRQLGSNADRYVEPEPELDSDGKLACSSCASLASSESRFLGEEIVEPEVDISALLERQRLSPGPSVVSPPSDEDDDVDTSLAHIGSEGRVAAQSRKGRVQQIEWDAELEELSREKAAAEATRGECCADMDSAGPWFGNTKLKSRGSHSVPRLEGTIPCADCEATWAQYSSGRSIPPGSRWEANRWV